MFSSRCYLQVLNVTGCCMIYPLCKIFACQQCMWVYESSRTVLVCVRVHACVHWPCACAYFESFWVTQLSFLWCGWTVILSSLGHVLWKMLAAFVVPLPVLLFWHFHTMVHLSTVMLLSLSNYYSLNSSSQERLASQCRIHGTRYIIKEEQQGSSVTQEQRWLTVDFDYCQFLRLHLQSNARLMLFLLLPCLDDLRNLIRCM